MLRTLAVLGSSALMGLPLAALAQQTTLCTSLVTDNPQNPYADGIVAVSETFPVAGSGDYTREWIAYIDQKYPHKLKRTSQCSSPADDPATAAQGRLNFIARWQAGFKTDLSPWRPSRQEDAASGQTARVAGDAGQAGRDEGGDDAATGAAAGRAGAAPVQASASSTARGQRPICATQPWDAPNTAFPQGSARKITNTCREPLSVRICLRIAGQWDCGVNWNVKPGEDWSWGSTKPYTGWFWDARLASANEGLAHPDD